MARTILGGVLALLFIVAATLQYNDPDREPWIALYAMAAIAAGALAVQGRALGAVRRGLAIGVAGIAIIWGVLLLPFAVREGIALSHEASREIGGLITVVVGLLVLAAAGPGRRVKRTRPRPHPDADPSRPQAAPQQPD